MVVRLFIVWSFIVCSLFIRCFGHRRPWTAQYHCRHSTHFITAASRCHLTHSIAFVVVIVRRRCCLSSVVVFLNLDLDRSRSRSFAHQRAFVKAAVMLIFFFSTVVLFRPGVVLSCRPSSTYRCAMLSPCDVVVNVMLIVVFCCCHCSSLLLFVVVVVPRRSSSLFDIVVVVRHRPCSSSSLFVVIVVRHCRRSSSSLFVVVIVRCRRCSSLSLFVVVTV